MGTLIFTLSLLASISTFAQNKTITVDYYNMGEIQMMAEQGRIINQQESKRIAYENFMSLLDRIYIIKDYAKNLKDKNLQSKLNVDVEKLLNENRSLQDAAIKSNYNRKLKRLEMNISKLEKQIYN
ncbi:hypothetical protein ACMGDK_11310 [Chryseobacterium sp. DT-3]|uniref:hypothetical protein n=1 Tax=Chryseobacterium sp. DT-3 TaxID=3396164 RepID=UPI003F1B7819